MLCASSLLCRQETDTLSPSLTRADEELGSVSVLSGVGHGDPTGAVVRQDKVFIFEFVAVNALPARSVTTREVTPLAHELGDDTVEAGPFVAELGRRASRYSVHFFF